MVIRKILAHLDDNATSAGVRDRHQGVYRCCGRNGMSCGDTLTPNITDKQTLMEFK
jgi:hypothetical protein